MPAVLTLSQLESDYNRLDRRCRVTSGRPEFEANNNARRRALLRIQEHRALRDIEQLQAGLLTTEQYLERQRNVAAKFAAS